MGDGEEETPFDHVKDDPQYENIEAEAAVAARKARSSPQKESEKRFCSLPVDTLLETTEYEMFYGVNEDEKLIWKVFGDTEYISTDEDPMEYLDVINLKKPELSINLNDEEIDMGSVFFDNFFPAVKGHAKLLDEYFQDNRAACFNMVANDNVKFHDSTDADPDWIVKQCHLLLIATVTEAESGVENLWKRGPSGGRIDHADFGRYIPVNYFKAFTSNLHPK